MKNAIDSAAGELSVTTARWKPYLKAGAVFVLTTVVYGLARTAGVLPAWMRWDSSELADEVVHDSIGAGQRRLLQDSNNVTVIHPIPDQIIEATQEYIYSLNNVFSQNYTLKASGLPAWLSIEYEKIGSKSGSMSYGNDLIVQGNLAFVGGSNGLQIFDVSNPANPVKLGFYATYLGLDYGYVYGIVVQGNLAFIAGYRQGLIILDVSNPLNPVKLGSYDTPGWAHDVAVQNNVAFVADSSSLQIIDVSNTINPVWLGSFLCSARGIVLQNNLGFVAAFDQKLLVMDVSNPVSPIQIGFCDTPGSAHNVVLEDDLAFVADGESGLQIIDVSDPVNPIRVGFYNAPGGSIGVAVKDGMAFIADGNLQVIDVSNPMSPMHLGFYRTSYRNRGVSNVFVQTNRAFVISDDELHIVDLTRGQFTGTPTLSYIGRSWVHVSAWQNGIALASDLFELVVNQFPLKANNHLIDLSLFPEQSLSLHLDSDQLFTVDDHRFLSLSLTMAPKDQSSSLGISLLLSPVFMGTYSGLYAQSLAVKGDLVFLLGSPGGLEILDVSNPTSPVLIGSYGNQYDYFRDVSLQGGVAFIASGSGLLIIDISNPENPVRLGFYDTPVYAGKVVLQGNLAFVEDHNSIQVIDISNPTNPLSVGFYGNSTSNFYTGIAVRGSVAFTASLKYDIWPNKVGLEIVDISTPTPVFLGFFDIPYASLDLEVQSVQDNLLFLSDGYGLKVVDVSNLTNPTLIDSYSMPFVAADIRIQNNVVFAAGFSSGVQMLDAHDPSNLIYLGGYDSPGFSVALELKNSLLFVADASVGLQILDISQWQLTIQPNVSEVGNYQVRLTATDELGGSVFDTFTIRVEGPPQIHGVIPFQYAKVGHSYRYFLPENFFHDPNEDTLTFSASLISGEALPDWLSFNGFSTAFAGIPASADKNNLTIIITAMDNIASSANVTFNLYIDHAPVVNQALMSQVAGVDQQFYFQVPGITFNDKDDDNLTYSAEITGGGSLPSWLNFDAGLQVFSGLPGIAQAGPYDLTVIARDPYQGEAQMRLELLVEQAPQVGQLISASVVDVGQPFQFSVDPASFVDAQGEGLSYSVHRGDGSTLPSWLSFYAQNLIFSGVAPASELGMITVQVIATDSYGGQAIQSFNLSVTYFPRVINPIVAPPLLREERYFSFVIPSATFSDLDDPILKYSASRPDNGLLPDWCQFDANQLLFSGVPSVDDVGKLSLVLTAQDSRGGAAAAPFDLIILPNFPPEISNSISDQSAFTEQVFSFFVPEDTFMDRNQDPLSYEAKQADGQPLPHWLQFNQSTVSFFGKPGYSDRGVISSRILKIALTARDDKSAATAFFNLNVKGDSYFSLFLKYGAPVFSVLGGLRVVYKNRAACLNRYQKERFQRPAQAITAGEMFEYELKTPANKIAIIRVRVPRAPAVKNCQFFSSPQTWLLSSEQPLPGGLALPLWMKYDTDRNVLRSKGLVPSDLYYRELMIQALDADGVIREETTVRILAAEPSAQALRSGIDDEENSSRLALV